MCLLVFFIIGAKPNSHIIINLVLILRLGRKYPVLFLCKKIKAYRKAFISVQVQRLLLLNNYGFHLHFLPCR